MSPSKLGTIVAILATTAGFSALAGSAQAQISGTIGGDFVDAPPVHKVDVMILGGFFPTTSPPTP